MEPIPGATRPDEKNWGMLAHLLTLLGYLVLFGHCLPPLVIYLTKKDESPFVADQAREALNFQLTILLVYVLSIPAMLPCITIPFVLVALALAALAQLVLPIVAAVHAADGKAFRYPLTLRLIS